MRVVREGCMVLVLAIGVSAQQSDTTRNPLANDALAPAAGRALYDQTCQSCHGPAGQGDRGPALNTNRFVHGSEDGDLFHSIRAGVPGTQMPPFQRLTDTQVWQLVSYIRSLGRSAPSAARPTAPPVSVTVKTKDGRELSGVQLDEDTFSVRFADASGVTYVFDKLKREAHRIESGGVTADRLEQASAEPQNWLMYWGDYASTHYSPLTQIDTTNVAGLRAAWTYQMPGDSLPLEATPLVVDGVMYTTQPGVVVALDARTGRQIWRYSRPQAVKNPHEINPYNRGVAIAGNRLFVGTLDAALVSIDASTGKPLWDVQVADTMLGYSLTSAPLVVKDKVLVGITGGEFGARGFLDAYDAATGRRLWRWYAVPGPGEFGNDTWKGDSWRLGGSPMWLTGSYDRELNLVYWTVGNPGPQIDRSTRGDLDNLFSDSIVAIDPDTGQRQWHYQFTPNDGHDWDSCQAVVLVDREWHGQRRKLLLHADRNGMFYVLDRTNGAFLSGTPFVYQNWNSGFDNRGRPIIIAGSNSSREGSFFVYPNVGGGTNFQAPSYSPLSGWLYLEYREGGVAYVSAPTTYEAGVQYIGRVAARAGATAAPKPGEPPASAGIKAIDPETGKTIWDFKISRGSLANGVLATAGNIVFGAVGDGNLVALDAKTGAHLWHFQTNANMAASPMSYAVDGRQFVAIAAGTVVYAFALPEQESSAYAATRAGEIVRLEDSTSGTIVSIVPSVGNIAFAMNVKGKNVLHWPFASVADFKARPTLSGVPFLGPWANRLDEQAFYANGKRYPFDMELGNVRGAIPIHGFLTTAAWQVREVKADARSAWLTSRLEVFKNPEWMKQWPFAHSIEMTYRLQDGVLEVRTTITNMSAEPMPVAVGFHPYLRLTDAPRDAWRLSIAARTHWPLGPNKIPTGETEPIERIFATPASALADYNLDDVFGDLVRDARGRATMTVAGASQRLDIELGPNYRAVVVWAPNPADTGRGSQRLSGPPNPVNRGEFICIEPMAAITDALNLARKGVYQDLQSIPAGGVWQESFWIRPSGF